MCQSIHLGFSSLQRVNLRLKHPSCTYSLDDYKEKRLYIVEFLCPQRNLGGIQEVFHVYLNKFENAGTHLFLVIVGDC